VDDRSKLDDTFEDWERIALSAIREIEPQGRSVRKIMVNAEILMAWCRQRTSGPHGSLPAFTA
jgi:hypothetical protein